MFYVFMPHCSPIDTKADGAGFENRPFRGGRHQHLHSRNRNKTLYHFIITKTEVEDIVAPSLFHYNLINIIWFFLIKYNKYIK
jgi:hypothetical protein